MKLPWSKLSAYESSGLRAEEALAFITDFLKEEGFDEEVVKDFSERIADDIRGKVTVHTKGIFKELVKITVRECREKLKNKSYRELCWRISMFFQDKPKSRIRLYIENNAWIILPTLSLMTIVAQITTWAIK